MIGHLQGRLLHISGAVLLIDVHGVGYEVTASGSILSSNPGAGQEVELYIHTDVKETAITLFGFRDLQEKQVFLLLRKVKGIGSRLALNILGSLGPIEVLSTIGRSDAAALQRVPGIGRKTAQRLIVELREGVGLLAVPAEAGTEAGLPDFPRPSAPERMGAEVDARLALEKLGFAPETARRAVAEALAELPQPGDAGDLLRAALARL